MDNGQLTMDNYPGVKIKCKSDIIQNTNCQLSTINYQFIYAFYQN